MDNVITFDSKKKAQEDGRKRQLLEVLTAIKEQVESGEIQELVACSLDKDGGSQIHVCILDFAGGIGLFEIGKNALLTTKI